MLRGVKHGSGSNYDPAGARAQVASAAGGGEKAHFGTTFGCVFCVGDKPYSPDFGMIARAYGAEGVQIKSAEEFKPALERAIASNRPVVIDVAMQNEPVPTGGHWNINDIYSPGREVSHLAVEVAIE